MYLVYNKRLKKSKKENNRYIYIFFHCITKERASVQIYAIVGIDSARNENNAKLIL